MTDKARELLAAEYDRAGERETAKWLRGGGSKIDDINIRAINAALRTAPDGRVMVPIKMTDAMRDAGNMYVKDRGALVSAYLAMLAAAQEPSHD